MSFSDYLSSIGAKQSPYALQRTGIPGTMSDHDGSWQYSHADPNYSYGQGLNPNIHARFTPQQVSDGYSGSYLQNNGRGDTNHQFGNMYLDNQNQFLGFGGSPDELYANSPLLARQYQESIADGGLGAAQAEQLRIQNEQQRLAAEQARQAARQTDTPQYQGGNIMGLMQYQPQQQQAPQQQAPQQGLLGGGLHRPGFVANPGAGNGQTGGVQ